MQQHPHRGAVSLPQVRTVDELLHGDRFKAERIEGDVSSEAWWLTERATGLRFVGKKAEAERPYQAQNEVIVAYLLNQLGEVWPRAGFAVAGRSDWAIMEHIEDRPGGRRVGSGTEVIGDTAFFVDTDRVERLVEALADPTEPLRILLADFMADNIDRYDHNWEVLEDPTTPGRLRLVPIDHADCLAGNPDPAEEGVTYEAHVADRLATASTLEDFYTGADSLWWVHFEALAAGRLTDADVAAAYDRVARGWAAVVPQAGWLRLEGVDAEHAQVVHRILWTRLAALHVRRAEHVAFLLGREPSSG